MARAGTVNARAMVFRWAIARLSLMARPGRALCGAALGRSTGDVPVPSAPAKPVHSPLRASRRAALGLDALRPAAGSGG